MEIDACSTISSLLGTSLSLKNSSTRLSTAAAESFDSHPGIRSADGDEPFVHGLGVRGDDVNGAVAWLQFDRRTPSASVAGHGGPVVLREELVEVPV